MTDPATYEVDFEPIGKRVLVEEGVSLLAAAQAAGVHLSSTCGGDWGCGQCQVIILEGQVSEPNSNEKFILEAEDLAQNRRLACSTQVLGDVKVHVPKDTLVTGQRLQVEGSLAPLRVDPAVAGIEIETDAPTIQDLRSDLARINAAISKSTGSSVGKCLPSVVSQISAVARQESWRVQAYLRRSELVGISVAGDPALGLAVDLGTTKIAAYLVDLQSGETLSQVGAMNPQISYGEDVISRLKYATRSVENQRLLARIVWEALNELASELVRQTGQHLNQVVDACIVGNTAMLHLLLELPVRQLATAPYVAASDLAFDLHARPLGLMIAPGAYVHILPCIGGFVGADHVAMILATDLDHSQKVRLGLDIGTNTEIALVKPDVPYLSSVACASGPAFEGAHISDGMRAASGAIEAVRLTDQGIKLRTIDDAPPVGLCGSGIVDAVAELRRWSLINTGGRLQKENSRLRQGRQGMELLLASASQSGSGRDVVISQEDINEIQLAKGAIRAGLEALLQATETPPETVEEVIIAGAFGSFLNIDSACDIGFFPEMPNAIFRQVGNAAGLGARMALLSLADRERAQEIATHTRYIELTTYPNFALMFARGMQLPPDDRLKIKY
jgi:uncharacterized 2Fe-2S/4Fe-4S cluster protein (DUF4445 family)